MTLRRWLLGLAFLQFALAQPGFARESDSVPVIGLLRASLAAARDPTFDVLDSALQRIGYFNGKNIRLELFRTGPYSGCFLNCCAVAS